MEFPKDEVKNKISWTKGADITDGSPRYTFEGRVIYIQHTRSCLIGR